jgi:hypothetical protein
VVTVVEHPLGEIEGGLGHAHAAAEHTAGAALDVEPLDAHDVDGLTRRLRG